MTTSRPDLDFAQNEDQAKARADQFRELDPFPSVPSALLSSAEIEDYARITAMLNPFYPHSDYLKSASYEVRPSRKFVRWDEDGNRLEDVVQRGKAYVLPPNSITYMQIESKIRLPDYIAIRFNLRIKHVHRGLLLGTGPLVDPGFSGDLLIPLHNLTSDPYEISGDEGLIWIEFTKTSLEVRRASPEYVRRGKFNAIEQRKTDVAAETYFQRANQNKPIKSSIPEGIRLSEGRAAAAVSAAEQSKLEAQNAAKSARAAETSARNQTRLYFGISALAIIVSVLALHQYLGQIIANVETTLALAGTINSNADQAKSDSARASADVQQLRTELETAKAQITTSTAENQRLKTDLETANKHLDALAQQVQEAIRRMPGQVGGSGAVQRTRP